MTNSQAIDILRHPLQHPVLIRPAIDYVISVLSDIEDTHLFCFRLPVQVERQCYFVHEGAIWGRDVKAYRIRSFGSVYVDVYSPPQGRLLRSSDIHVTRELAEKELFGTVRVAFQNK